MSAPASPPASVVVAPPVVAIDGPAASGKGLISRLLAAELGFHCLDSGALYRAAALAALRRDARHPEEIAALARELAEQPEHLAALLADAALSAPATGERASQIAALPELRAELLPLQRSRRHPPGLVADGRDMAAVVFPDAVLKVFLTAKLATRARRRRLQLQERGVGATIASVRADLRARDARDAGRQHAALARDPAAHLVESDFKSPEEIVRELKARFRAARFCPHHRAPAGDSREPPP